MHGLKAILLTFPKAADKENMLKKSIPSFICDHLL